MLKSALNAVKMTQEKCKPRKNINMIIVNRILKSYFRKLLLILTNGTFLMFENRSNTTLHLV